MPGWKCTNCGGRTWRRPPNTLCDGCRSSWRGRPNKRLKPQTRCRAKSYITASGGCRTRVQAGASPVVASTGRPRRERDEENKSVTWACSDVTPPNSPLGRESTPTAGTSTSSWSAMQVGPAPTDLDTFLDKQYEDLSNLVGKSAAHTVRGCARRVVERIRQANCQLPEFRHDEGTGLVCLAIALSSPASVPGKEGNCDVWRQQWQRRLGLQNVKQIQAIEALWVSAMPFESDLHSS
jgi:hypothetical protein